MWSKSDLHAYLSKVSPFTLPLCFLSANDSWKGPCQITTDRSLDHRMLLKRRMGSRETGIGNRESGIGNRESGIENREWGMGFEKYWSAVISKKLSLSLRSTAKRQGLHVVSETWKVRMSICQFFLSLELLSFCLLKLTKTIDLQLMRVTIMLRITRLSLSTGWFNKYKLNTSKNSGKTDW